MPWYAASVIIVWDETENSDSYKIYRDNIWLGLNNLSDNTEYIDQIAELGIVYEYCIEAINDCGESDFSCDTGFSDIAGDVNGDGEINVLDVITLLNMILEITGPDYASGDMNADDALDVLDVVNLVNIVLGS